MIGATASSEGIRPNGLVTFGGVEIEIGQNWKKSRLMKKLLLLVTAAVAVSVVATHAADAKALYEKDCAKCHGADGKGQTKMGQKLGVKDYTDAKVQAEMKDDAMANTIK